MQSHDLYYLSKKGKKGLTFASFFYFALVARTLVLPQFMGFKLMPFQLNAVHFPTIGWQKK